ncbi:hypothetical protein [Nitrospira sp. Kam-Ns4a]
MRHSPLIHKMVVAAGAVAFAALLLLAPHQVAVDRADETWIDRLVTFVTVQQLSAGTTPAARFDLYFEQLARVRAAVRAGDHPRAYAAMNRLMDMLEAREGGIAPAAAEAIWDYCYQVTPAAYHDVSRHLRGRHRAEAGALAFREPTRR